MAIVAEEKKVKAPWSTGARMFALSVCLVLLFSFLAQAVNSNGFKVNKTYVTVDVRGADLGMELYKPTNVDSSAKLPCIVLAHGGSEDIATTSLMAWELARRGFVVLNANMYGAGTSEQPVINDSGQIPSKYTRDSSLGYFDALQYARTLVYVDQTRIGMWGHSQGYLNESAAIYLDGAYYTMNDRMFNVLHDVFGLKITEKQLTQKADDIAVASLKPNQLAFYNYLKTEQRKIFDTRVKAARISASYFGKPVMVAGLKVVRDPQMNLTVGMGTHETPKAYYLGTSDQYKGIFHTGTGDVSRLGWYDIPDWSMDPKATSSKVGSLFQTSILSSADLKKAVEDRSARMLYSPETFHSGNIWSPAGISQTVEFFTQALEYNNGELAGGAAHPIASQSLVCFYALALTTLAVLSMIGMLVSLACVLIKRSFFAPCRKSLYEPMMTITMPIFWISAVVTAVITYLGSYMSTRENEGFQFSNATMTKFLPYEPGQIRLFFMIAFMGVVGVVAFILLSLVFGKKNGPRMPSIKDLNISAGWEAVLKTVLLCLAVFGVGYLAADVVQYLFGQRLLYLDGSFEVMKPYGFGRLIRYALILLPFTLMISGTSNMTIVKNVSDRMDTLISVVVNSIGAYIFLAVAFYFTFRKFDSGVFYSLHTALSLFTLIPIANYLYRKMFKLSGSVWAGAILVALVLAWRLSGFNSHMFMYYGPDRISALFGIY
jgi:hypothetical protein